MNSSGAGKGFRPGQGSQLTGLVNPGLAVRSSRMLRADGFLDHAPDSLATHKRASDRGGNSLATARSLRPYLQGFAPPGTNRTLRDTTGRRDPDCYRLFDNQSPNTFQADGLLISYNLHNLSNAAIAIHLLDRQGDLIAGGSKTVAAGQSFVSSNSLSRDIYYIRVTSTVPGRHRYQLYLPIINS